MKVSLVVDWIEMVPTVRDSETITVEVADDTPINQVVERALKKVRPRDGMVPDIKVGLAEDSFDEKLGPRAPGRLSGKAVPLTITAEPVEAPPVDETALGVKPGIPLDGK